MAAISTEFPHWDGSGCFVWPGITDVALAHKQPLSMAVDLQGELQVVSHGQKTSASSTSASNHYAEAHSSCV
jgi:hypothetical protein